jgi:hypothetical protein
MEGAGYNLNHVILDVLEHGNEALSPSGAVPELCSPSHNRQTHSIKHNVPVSHGEAAYGVSQHLQRLDRHVGSVAHDADMWFPFKATVYEEPKVSQGFHRPNHVVCACFSIQ